MEKTKWEPAANISSDLKKMYWAKKTNTLKLKMTDSTLQKKELAAKKRDKKLEKFLLKKKEVAKTKDISTVAKSMVNEAENFVKAVIDETPKVINSKVTGRKVKLSEKKFLTAEAIINRIYPVLILWQ